MIHKYRKHICEDERHIRVGWAEAAGGSGAYSCRPTTQASCAEPSLHQDGDRPLQERQRSCSTNTYGESAWGCLRLTTLVQSRYYLGLANHLRRRLECSANKTRRCMNNP